MRARGRFTALKLAFVGVGMFAFAVFLLPPLYDWACQVLGINGKSIGTVEAEPVAVDQSRQVTVEFLANVYQGTPLEFKAPSPSKIKVHPGEVTEVSYTARNLSGEPLWVQAVHSIVPSSVGKHVNVLACFCFDEQKFEPGEARELTFAFQVSPKLSQAQETISVSYTFFKLEKTDQEQQ